MSEETTTLFRPVGQKELDLIREANFAAFPPRLFWQPISYPVLTEEYATGIARDWNAKDPASGYVGYVTRFRVKSEFLQKYDVQTVGSSAHREYWIPAAELAEFNRNIVGPIAGGARRRSLTRPTMTLPAVRHRGRFVRARDEPGGPVVGSKLIHHEDETDHRPPDHVAFEIHVKALCWRAGSQGPPEHRAELERLADDATTGFKDGLKYVQPIELGTAIDEVMDSGCRTAR